MVRRAREKDVRYGQVMALYRDAAGKIDDDSDQAAIFAPFAGTEGYSPIAYLPYIPAAAIGRLLKLDFPDLLLLMRLFGIAAFTAVAAYAIRVSPVLKWGFVLIAMLPVSLYNRSVLSADGAALSSALVITALCLSAARKSAAGPIWERSLWMTLCALSKQPQIIFVLLELMTSRVTDLRQRWRSVLIVILPCLILSPLWVAGISRDRGLAPPNDRDHPPRIQSGVEAFLHVGASIAFSAGGLDDFHRLGRQALAGADRHPGLAGYLASILDLPGLTVFLLFVAVQRLQLDGVTRARLMALTGLTVLGYVVVVF